MILFRFPSTAHKPSLAGQRSHESGQRPLPSNPSNLQSNLRRRCSSPVSAPITRESARDTEQQVHDGERRHGERAVVNLNLIARSFIREAAGVGAIMEAWIFMETRAPCNLYETTATRRRPADRRDASRFTLSVRALAELNYPCARTRKT